MSDYAENHSGAARYTAFGSHASHSRLGELLPLGTPLSVLVDPAGACNLRCNYCPTGHPELLEHRRGLMPRATFTNVIRGLEQFPSRVARLHLYKDGEPLLNRHIGWMVTEAVRADVACSVELTTNGTLLTSQLAEELVAGGLKRIRISVQPSRTGGRQDSRSDDLYEQVAGNVRYLRSVIDRTGADLHIHVKTVQFAETDKIAHRVVTEFNGVADSVHVDRPMGWNGSRPFDFTLSSSPPSGMTAEHPLNETIQVCPQPFYTLCVNDDGSVSICCVDWSRELVVGNVNADRLVDIWSGSKINELRRAHLAGRRCEIGPCASCQYIHGSSPESVLDEISGDLLKYYQN